MAWNHSDNEAKRRSTLRRKSATPGWLKGVVAGIVVIAGGVIVYSLLPHDEPPLPDAVPKKAAEKDIKFEPSKAPTQMLEKPVEEPKGSGLVYGSDSNIVWKGKFKYEVQLSDGSWTTVLIDDPNAPKPKPIFKAKLNNYLTNFLDPGEPVPPVPIEFNDNEILEALMEPIEILEEDDESTRYAKEAISLVQEQLKKDIKEGKTVEEFIKDLQRRQDQEAELLRQSRDMILEELANENPQHAKELYEKLNEHLRSKGLPSMKLAKKFKKMMGVE